MAYALRVAVAKATAVRDSRAGLSGSRAGEAGPSRADRVPSRSGDGVLAADTVVALDGVIFGKARDAAEAEVFLARLSGRTHAVHTALALRADGRLVTDLVTTRVRFRVLASAEIARYVAGGEPADKAGAYGIQGEGGALVAEVQGSYTNVVGLPLEETLRLLRLHGVIE